MDVTVSRFRKDHAPLAKKPGIVALVISARQGLRNDFMAVNCQHRFSEDDACSGIVTFERTVSGQTIRFKMAGAAALPICNCFYYFQRQFIEGVAQSGIKG